MNINDQQAKIAIDHIIDGLNAQGPHAESVSDWFVSATLFKQVIDSLHNLNLGYEKILYGISYVFSSISKYGPDVATIVAKIVEEGKPIFYPQG